jgi:hypothetical protein
MRRIANMLARLWRWMLSRFGKPTMSNTEAWRALAERIIAKGKLIFDTSSVFQSEKGTRNPKVWGAGATGADHQQC